MTRNPGDPNTEGNGIRRISRYPAGLASASFILLLAGVAIVGPVLYPGDPLAISEHTLLRPGGAYWLGTDDLGRDVLAELVYGVRVSLFVGFVAAFAATVAVFTSAAAEPPTETTVAATEPGPTAVVTSPVRALR